jgi:phospholipase/lecithinase/hemolysin
LQGGTNGTNQTVCDNPDAYVFFDDIHPSSRSHQELTDSIKDLMTRQGLLPSLAGGGGNVSDIIDAALGTDVVAGRRAATRKLMGWLRGR